MLAGQVVETRREHGGSASPHFQIRVVDADGVDYRIAVNIQSQLEPSQLLYLADEDFRHPITERLPASGWTPLDSTPEGGGLDMVRGGLFDPALMVPLPPDLPGADNDLSDRLTGYLDQAIADPSVTLYAFGQRWGPEGKSDKIFGFRPGNGVHDIHMNQGNSGRFTGDDGVWQDGGLLLRFADHWTAVFLAFQSQSWNTDDRTGHAVDEFVPRARGAAASTV
ncbi:YukJ family protein [Actinocorallia lasiicapitis]